LGREPGPWQQWWEANRESFARQQAEEAAAGDLFRQFRGNVLLGQWDAALAAVSTGAMEGASPENLQRELAGLAQTLRTAYRASSVQGLRLRAAEGVLIIDWGRKGFEFDELPLVRQAEGWRFACRPWDVRLVKKPRKPVQTSPLEFHMRHRRRSVFASAGNWKFFLALLGIVAAFGTAGLLAHAYGGILEGIFGYLFAGLIIVAPTALIIYSFYFGRPKAPRRLPCDRNHHHPHHPNAS